VVAGWAGKREREPAALGGQRAGGALSDGVMSYAPSTYELWRRVAYADRILKGAKPGELPVEQASKFELLVNMRTARLLGLTVPASVLVRADRVLE